MTTPEKTAFTLDDLKHWAERASLRLPNAPTAAECMTCKSLDSFNGMGMPTGFVIRLALDDGETLTVKLNPAIAVELVKVIRETGIKAGWTDGNDHVTFPITRT